ncbi:hypothetical protein B0H16DRAFT_1687784 [Mycena metata]|uniref:Uncharacterized protein n=1 Tax=Mycena metata TaxID=1033252 RepID=A0AAD7NK35_9AGAR|nr:hypothetical protein B0H16DRAFT_1687784 [Mycena metata]
MFHNIPTATYPDLWPRVWQWSHFFETYPHCNPKALSREESRTFSVRLCYFISHLREDDTARDLIDSTPGVRVVLAKTWGIMLEESQLAIFDLCRFLGRDPAVSNHTDFLEFVEGAGGTISDLALLVVKHITWSCGELPTWPVSQIGLDQRNTLLHGGSNFLLATRAAKTDTFFHALISHGIVKALIEAALALGEKNTKGTVEALHSCFLTLAWIWDVEGADRRSLMREALGAGLMRALVLSAVHPCTPSPVTVQCLQQYLGRFIPEALTYHSVLSIIMQFFRSVEDLVETKRFRESKIFKEWRELEGLVQDRLRVLEWYNSKDYESLRSCQIPDWTAGGHRDSCQYHRQVRSQEVRYVPGKDRSFIRACFDAHYTAARRGILSAQLSFIKENPSTQFYVLLSYKENTVTFDVQPVSINPGVAVEEWKDYVSRVNASGGRMELHVLEHGSGDRGRSNTHTKLFRCGQAVGKCMKD